MAPTIHIFRHAESRHNVELDGHAIRDPELTTHGVVDAAQKSCQFEPMPKVKKIISSPMRRAIQTAGLIFRPLIEEQGMKIILYPDLQECSSQPSDTGSPPDELRAEFGFAIDETHLSDGWWYKGASESYGGRSREIIAERARQARLFIRNVAKSLNDDDHIVVVTHSLFIPHLIENGPKFRNAEFRSCHFVDLLGDDSQATLVISEPVPQDP
ncbi:hypothetical protein EKO27_g4682 [Xylaria grammica]|uniref:Uncharacterized protein n=1 Tax=Xylaria grammica TaxID=363999 RepID=A0A439D7Q2_9PEZI|nr:hypothetical protein EKO27_g4682 [Xylaria grammica]